MRCIGKTSAGVRCRREKLEHRRSRDCVIRRIGGLWERPTGRLVVDIDSFGGEVHGYAKQASPTATRGCGAISRFWPRARTRARRFARGLDGVGQHVARRVALRRGVDRPRRPGRRDGPEAAQGRLGLFGTRRSSRGCSASAGATRSGCVCNRPSAPRSRRSSGTAGRRLRITPPASIAQTAETTLVGQRLIMASSRGGGWRPRSSCRRRLGSRPGAGRRGRRAGPRAR